MKNRKGDNLMDCKELMKEAETFFYQAMQQGYATSPKKGTIVELPGSKTITFEEENFKLMDCWFTTPDSNRSWGFTQIWHRESETSVWAPIWVMHYWGEYKPEAIPVLKEALKVAYSNPKPGKFQGCRGPKIFAYGEIAYANSLDTYSTYSFSSFSGSEGMAFLSKLDERWGIGFTKYDLGSHHYRGWSLLPD